MAPAASGERSLEETPTWAVAVVCAVFVIVSIFMEHGIHSLGKWFQKRHKKAMNEALEKMKSELMLLGFISLLLTVGGPFVSKICIPASFGEHMLPCNYNRNEKDGGGEADTENIRRKLLSLSLDDSHWRRVLAAAPGGETHCSSQGKIPIMSQTGIHQLHIFIFVLAVFHVLYSVITMALAQAKMKKWKTWEAETSSLEYEFTNDPSRFRFARQTSFVRRHSGLSRIIGLRWIVAFFRQFFASVTKVDYMTMRHGFINAHLAANSKFNFHKYIKRSMEDDFKVVVGISLPLWIFAIVFLLLNVYKWYTLTWLSLAPLIILLLVATKLQLIIMEMAQEIQDRTTVVKGAPVVEPSNKFFWFNKPEWIILLIHFTLFENAFQMAYFLWICYEFGITSCFHENMVAIVTRVLLGVAVQILCSYITFPLYALVTQMGSHMKKAIFEEQTAKALKNWQKAARGRRKMRKSLGEDESSHHHGGLMSGETTPSHSHGVGGSTSPLNLLPKHHKSSSQPDLDGVITSPRSYQSDYELSEIEESTTHKAEQQQQQQQQQRNNNEGTHKIDFTFANP